MKKLRALIVDDEALARQVLREFLAGRPDVEIVAECANGFEAVKAAAEHHPELLFLDIQMPKLDGFEVLELIGQDPAIGPAVVFVTAFDTHAIRAFEVHAVDYLLKPFSAERLEAALERAVGRVLPKPAELAAAARPPAQYAGRVVVREGAKITIIPMGKLDYAEAQDDYVALAAEGRTHLKQQTLASLEAGLDPARFVRLHRRYIVNLERLARIEAAGKDAHIAVLDSGQRLPVSASGYARLRGLGLV